MPAAWVAQKSVGLDCPEIPDFPQPPATSASEAIDAFIAGDPEDEKVTSNDDFWTDSIDKALTIGLL